MIASHFGRVTWHMAFISLMRWHAIVTFEQATKDMIRRFRPSLRSLLYVQFGCVMVCLTLHYTVGLQYRKRRLYKDVGIKWSVRMDAEISIPWCHCTPGIEISASILNDHCNCTSLYAKIWKLRRSERQKNIA